MNLVAKDLEPKMSVARSIGTKELLIDLYGFLCECIELTQKISQAVLQHKLEIVWLVFRGNSHS